MTPMTDMLLKVNRNDIGRPSEQVYQTLLSWLDSIPFSRQKKNICNDFSDAVMAAEILHHFLPKIVDMHNYSQADSVKLKEKNWLLLNRRVLRDIAVDIDYDVIRDVVTGKPWTIETVLLAIQVQIQIHLTKHREHTSKRPLKQQKSFDFRSALQQFGGGTHLKDSMIMGVAYTMGAVKDSPNVIDNGYLGIHNIESTRVLPVHFLPNNMIYRDNHLDIASFREEEKVSIMELKQREFSINKCDDSIKRLQLRIKILEQASHIKDVQITKLLDDINDSEKTLISKTLTSTGKLPPPT